MRGLPPALILTLAIMAGASMDATIKFLQATNHVLTVTLGRYAFGTLFALALWAYAGRPKITAEMWRAHIPRGIVIAGCATTFFWALRVLPLVDAVTISFVYPLIVPFIASAMLGERIRTSSMGAALVGFLGVIIAAQGGPSVEESPQHALGVVAALTSAALFSVAMVLLRQRAQTDSAAIVGLMTSFIPGVILLGPTAAFATAPNFGDWPWFLLMGALAAVFMYLMATAYARAEAQQLAPVHYTELIYAGILGYLVFQETPRLQTTIGAALIVAASLYAAYDERRIARRREASS